MAEIKELCAPARQMAQWLYENPGKIYFPPVTPDWITYEDVARCTGMSVSGATQAIAKWGLNAYPRDPSRPRVNFVSKNELEAALVNLRDDRLVIDGRGYKQPLHKSLIVLFRNDIRPNAQNIAVLAEHMDHQKMSYFLGTKTDSNTGAFRRYDVKLPDGSYANVTMHQFRHWLDTLYRRGGLSEADVARLFGRKHVKDKRAYDHRTTAERAEDLRQAIREDRVSGQIVDAYKALPPELRETFLETQVTAYLITAAGGCIHDWAQSPCSLHLNCLSGCPEYTRTKGDVRERTELKRQRAGTVALLEHAKREMEDGAYGANNWVLHFERQLVNIDKALAIDDEMFPEDA